MEGHSDTVYKVCFQEDEPQLISGSADCTVKLWDIVAGKKYKTLTHHKKSVWSLLPHSIEYSFLSLAADGMKLWKCPEGSYIRSIGEKEDDEILSCFDVSGKDLIAVGSE